MRWWGKMTGGTLGFVIGGPVGALVGVALGHNVDRDNAVVVDRGAGSLNERELEQVQALFFTAIFTIMGYLTKQREAAGHEGWSRLVVQRMQLSESQQEVAFQLMAEGRQAGFPINTILAQFYRRSKGNEQLVRLFFEMLVYALYLERTPLLNEHTQLLHVSQKLNLSEESVKEIVSAVRTQMLDVRTLVAERVSDEQAYFVLGLASDVSDDEIKKEYRRLINLHHPDKLQARGVTQEMLALASERTRKIREAYQAIKLRRGFH